MADSILVSKTRTTNVKFARLRSRIFALSSVATSHCVAGPTFSSISTSKTAQSAERCTFSSPIDAELRCQPANDNRSYLPLAHSVLLMRGTTKAKVKRAARLSVCAVNRVSTMRSQFDSTAERERLRQCSRLHEKRFGNRPNDEKIVKIFAAAFGQI